MEKRLLRPVPNLCTKTTHGGGMPCISGNCSCVFFLAVGCFSYLGVVVGFDSFLETDGEARYLICV